MNIQQWVNLAFEQEMEQREGVVSKEFVKQVIDKIIEEYAKLNPYPQEGVSASEFNVATLLLLIHRKAHEMGIDITMLEISQELTTALSKYNRNMIR